MPLPFLFIGVAVLAGGFGGKKMIDAKNTQDEANDLNRRAQHRVDHAKRRAEESRKICGESLTELGKQKVDILNGPVKSFLDIFDLIHNVTLEESQGLDELSHFKVNRETLKNLRELTTTASSLAKGLASGATMGAVTAFGAYSAVGLLGTAGTGAAISGLTGVAATNATLAFLGGGTLAAGGLGMAGGMAVLGGLVAGPALAIMGGVMNSHAQANLEDARSNMADARSFESDMDYACSVCDGIRKRGELFQRLLIRLNLLLSAFVEKLKNVIRRSGTDYRNYSETERNVVAGSLAVVKAVKAVLDTSILTKDGKLTDESAEIQVPVEKVLGRYEG